MSKIGQIVATSYGLSMAASEEASRFSAHEIDVEHVLLALVIDDGTAGQVLRAMGIRLDAARDAVASQHRDQLASLGIAAEMPEEARIRFPQQGASDWSDRALKLLTDAGSRGKSGDTTAVLRELLVEPSGTAEGILTRLGHAPAAIAERLDDAEGIRARDARIQGRLSRTHTAFVPASVEDVWQLVSSPERLPDWEMNLIAVRPAHGAWEGTTRTVAPDGKALKGRPTMVRQLIDRLAADHPHHVTWEMRFPDAPRANRRSVSVDIEQAAGGSQVTVHFAWLRGAGPSRPLRLVAPLTRFVARPVVRLALWVQVTALTSAISRALRA
ncbi:Clp protease N-terminal domain-containing protein [Microbacterium gubbeenense]|uniref:SRPBCC family protein n=1 Tax=Microbacterium gubbeenense TaxID=159896 RepID=UPI003F99ECEB